MKSFAGFPLPFWLPTVIAMFLLCARLAAQDVPWPAAGHPLIRTYAPAEYGAFAQNWSITQDQRGIMYFANTGGILEYDGVMWRLIPVPNEVVRSLAVDSAGHVFAGGVGELGYLGRDATGQSVFTSLLDRIPADARQFADVWTLWVVGHRAYFQTLPYVFVFEWPADSAEPRFAAKWSARTAFTPAFSTGGILYFPQQDLGLFRLSGDSLSAVPAGDAFAHMSMYFMLPITKDSLLVGTREGIFVYGPASIVPLAGAADEFLRRHRPTLAGARLDNGVYALGTQAGGVLFMDRSGRPHGVLNKRNGLRSETIWFMFPDREGNLWLAMDDGIARIRTPSRVSILDERSGLEGGVVSLYRDGRTLYISTRTGVYFASSFEREPAFSRVAGITSPSWAFLRAGDALLTATTDGVYDVRPDRARLIPTGWRFAYTLYRSRRDDNIVYVGLHNGLAILRFNGRAWVDGGVVEGVTDMVRSIAEDDEGSLWLGTFFKGILRVAPAPETDSVAKVTVRHFGAESGLANEQVVLFPHGGKIFFGTIHGLKRYDETADFFKADTSFGSKYAGAHYRIKEIAGCDDGSIWILGGERGQAEIDLLTPVSGGFSATPVRELNAQLIQRLEFTSYVMFPDDVERALWLFNGERLIRLDTRTWPAGDTMPAFATMIRRVTIQGDSTVFNGGLQNQSLVLPYDLNSIRIEFAAASFADEAANRYQIMLEDFDQEWTAWSSETGKEYSHLAPATYRFHVRSKNILGKEGTEAVFAFTILPPWYRTPWAYLLFALFMGFMIWETGRVRTRVLRKKTEELEGIVLERTAQVMEQKNTLEEQAKKLVEMDRLKSRFFTNVSHEFRTPLTLILGQIEAATTEAAEERRASRLTMAARNARRLQRLINRLLDLARLESGRMTLQASSGNFVEFLKQRFLAFESLAEQKHITLKFHSPREQLNVYFDREKLEDVIDNLVSNALKWTGEGGQVRLDIRPSIDTDSVEFIISDTGIGIAPDRLPFIFDRFYRADESHEQEGSGIGLALAKEMIELHRGRIDVASTEGKGTSFTITLPIGRSHLTSDEILIAGDIEPDSFRNKIEAGGLDQAEAGDERPNEGGTSLPTVLVVEDNADMRMFIGDCLRDSCLILEAAHGEEGLAVAIERMPDLIITDVMMPRMDGTELCRRLKSDARTSHIPVVMLTAKAALENRLEGLETGADDYVVKPFNQKELRVRAVNLIHQRALLRQRFREVTAIDPAQVSAKPMDQAFLENVLSSIRRHIDDESYDVPTLGNDIGMSVSQLNRKLNALVDQSAGQLIRATRLECAATLLRQNAGTIAEIAYRVGFSDHASFTRSFKARFGCSPTEFVSRFSTSE